ncbi:MAG TPA: 16S rRNA (uracil(1498)-N(3))-methyltransferase [Acetobacteraceae bacterium]|nr:16S rRNA (uracil(1498)-N(3))-methyltransferase [Acetobacteraceae bacterium]
MRGSIRLFVSVPLAPGEAPLLDPAQAHYLGAVMRRRTGDEVALFNGSDGEFLARITMISAKGGRLAVERQLRPQGAEPGPWLAFAIIKRAAVELLVQKATELGAERLLPFRADRSAAALPNPARLTAIATEAAEQSERMTRPEIVPPATLAGLLAAWPADRPLFAAIERRAAPPLCPCGTRGGLLVGPEGGFTDRELDLLARSPFVRAISLGPRILRAETAAIAGLALLAAPTGGPTV